MLLSDVCLLRTLGLTREQRPRKTKIGTEVAHVTRDSDTSDSDTVRTYWAWETTATLRLLDGAQGAGAPTGDERGGAYHVATCTDLFENFVFYSCD